MAILEEANEGELTRLLDLFPIHHLRATFAPPRDKKAKKDQEKKAEDRKKVDLCRTVARARPLAQIRGFIDAHLGCCKQHVYVFRLPDDAEHKLALPADVVEGELVQKTNIQRALYLTKVVRGVILVDPVQQTTISFLWPILAEIINDHLVIRFVILEKNIAAYFNHKAYPGDPGMDERAVLRQLVQDLNVVPADLQKGIKHLWKADFMDGHHAKYKTSLSVAAETMHDEKGIKKFKPELYDVLLKSPLAQMLFTVSESKKLTVDRFGVDPAEGTLSFPRYSNTPGDSDRVIREILQHN